jgi:hypothetical protein
MGARATVRPFRTSEGVCPSMSSIIGIIVFLLLIAFVVFLKTKNDSGRPPV